MLLFHTVSVTLLLHSQYQSNSFTFVDGLLSTPSHHHHSTLHHSTSISSSSYYVNKQLTNNNNIDIAQDYSYSDRNQRSNNNKSLSSKRLQLQLNANQNDNEDSRDNMASIVPTPEAMQEFFETPTIEISFILLVLLSCLLVAINTLPSLSLDYIQMNILAQNAITDVFAIEFFLRWYAANMKSSHLIKPLTLIDIVVVIIPLALKILSKFTFLPILSIASTIISNSSGLTILLVLRVLRLQRVITDTDTFTKYIIALGLKPSEVRPYQLQLVRVVLSIFTLVSVSTGLIYTAEHEVNPAIPDYFTALYFGLTTLTTVGFGDITPVTFQGRLVVCGSILAGVAIIPAQAAELVEALLDLQNERIKKKKEQKAKAKSCFTFPDFPTEMETTADTKFAVITPECLVDDEDCDDEELQDFLLDMKRSCKKCRVMSHRVDALFCWNCGNGLRSIVNNQGGSSSNNRTSTIEEESSTYFDPSAFS